MRLVSLRVVKTKMITKTELLSIQREIEDHARAMGFDFYPVLYEMVDYLTMSEVAAYGGFPTRYPHWSFGMEYERLSKSYGFGLSKIYEMVINTNPVYAYLLDSNPLVDQKLVIAHVCGHAHFFKHNYMFAPTNRKMLDEMANHGQRVRQYMAKYGVEEVENFIDCCLTIEDLIDMHAPFIKRREEEKPPENEDENAPLHKLKASGYMEDYINPPSYLEKQRQQKMDEAKAEQHFPSRPEKDVLEFLINLCAAASVAARYFKYRARRGLLFRAAGPD